MTIPTLIGSPASQSDNGGSSATISFAVGAGTNRCLVVHVSSFDAGSTATGVTYGGVALTQVGAGQQDGGGGKISIWRLLAPTVGTANVVVTCGGAMDFLFTVVSAWQDVDQTTPFGTAAGASAANNSTPTVNVTTAVDDATLAVVRTYSNTTYTLTANGTSLAKVENNAVLDSGAAQYRVATTTTTTVSWTRSATNPSDDWQIYGVALKGTGGAVVLRKNSLMRLGAGR